MPIRNQTTGSLPSTKNPVRETLEFHTRALNVRRELGDRAGEGQTLKGMGDYYLDLGRFDEALECYTRALDVRRELGDRAGEGQTLKGMGASYLRLGGFDQALRVFMQALAIDFESQDFVTASKVMAEMSDLYGVLGRFEEASNAYLLAREFGWDPADREGERRSADNIGLPTDPDPLYERIGHDISKDRVGEPHVSQRGGQPSEQSPTRPGRRKRVDWISQLHWAVCSTSRPDPRYADAGMFSYIAGLFGAALFLAMSVGPGWTGFLIAFVPTSVLSSRAASNA